MSSKMPSPFLGIPVLTRLVTRKGANGTEETWVEIDSAISPTTWKVLVWFSAESKRKGYEPIDIGMRQLARCANVSKRSCFTAIRELVAEGYLEVTRQPRKGPDGRGAWKLLFPAYKSARNEPLESAKNDPLTAGESARNAPSNGSNLAVTNRQKKHHDLEDVVRSNESNTARASSGRKKLPSPPPNSGAGKNAVAGGGCDASLDENQCEVRDFLIQIGINGRNRNEIIQKPGINVDVLEFVWDEVQEAVEAAKGTDREILSATGLLISRLRDADAEAMEVWQSAADIMTAQQQSEALASAGAEFVKRWKAQRDRNADAESVTGKLRTIESRLDDKGKEMMREVRTGVLRSTFDVPAGMDDREAKQKVGLTALDLSVWDFLQREPNRFCSMLGKTRAQVDELMDDRPRIAPIKPAAKPTRPANSRAPTIVNGKLIFPPSAPY